jgi:glycerate-2-kinase
MGGIVRGGVVVTKYGHCEDGAPAGAIELIEAATPFPTKTALPAPAGPSS